MGKAVKNVLISFNDVILEERIDENYLLKTYTMQWEYLCFSAAY